MSDIDLKLCDLLEFAKMCAPEYNMPELSDRILVLDVMQDGWETASILDSASSIESGETTESAPMYPNSNEKPLSETSEKPHSEEVKEETLNETKDSEVETGIYIGNQSENESKNPQKLACEQDTNISEVASPTTSTSEDNNEGGVAKAAKPVLSNSSEYFDKPLRQHKIYVHSFWLSVQSPYFRSLFYSSGMKENKEQEVHVNVPESEENAYLLLLEAIYCGDVLNDRTVDELLAVLELANKYDLKFIFKKCKYVLQKNATTFEISTQIMRVIKVKHNMNDVEELAATIGLILAKEFSPLDNSWQSEKFTNLSEASLKYLLSNDDLIVQSENTVFHALMYWMEQNEIDPTTTSDLLAVVRLKLMMVDYLYNVVKSHFIASKMPKFNELFLDAMIYHALPAEQKGLLDDQPMVRKDPGPIILQSTPIITKQDFQAAQQTGKCKCSNEFWACGYKMSVGLIKNTVNFRTSYINAELTVHGLKKESLVPFQFSIEKVERTGSWERESFMVNCCGKKYSYINFQHTDFNNDCNLYVAVKPL